MESFYHRLRNIVSRYDSDNIFILGKGASVDLVNPRVFEKGIVIALNDGERIVPADITLFHDEWVIESIKKNGYKSGLYVTNRDLPDGVDRFYAPYVPADQESGELIVQRFNSEELLIENVMLVSALKCAKFIAEVRRRRQQVYLLGFDFDASRGFSKAFSQDFSGDEKVFQTKVISLQEHYLLVFLHLLRESSVHVIHVGEKIYSGIDAFECNRRFHLPQSVGGDEGESVCESKKNIAGDKENGQKKRVEIVAEFTTNHFGSTEKLVNMVRLAAQAGADYVKVQKRDVETFYSDAQLESPYNSPFGGTFRDFREGLELSSEQFEILDEECKRHGVEWFASVLDVQSFRFIASFGQQFVKLPSTISQHRDLLETVAKEHKGGIVVSTGYTDQEYEEVLLKLFRECPTLVLMQCNSAYPTPPGDCNIGVVRHYNHLAARYANIVPAYSSHDLGSQGSSLAVAAGSRMIEKHVKLGVTKWAHFDSVALDLHSGEFAQFVKDVRRAELYCGKDYKTVSESENHKYWVKS